MESNQKYKLLGFNHKDKISANIMVLSTGKYLNLGLKDLDNSEILDDFNRNELKAFYHRLYSDSQAITSYELRDRRERSWYAYFIITLLLTVICILCTVCGVKLSHLSVVDFVVPTGIFFYPLTFILIDILNEFYGLRMARRTILLSFIANIIFVTGLWATGLMPALDEWGLDEAYNEFVNSIVSVLLASSASYLVSENVNSWLLCKIKELTNSRYLFVRVITSTVVASIIDSILFCTLAFYNVLSFDIIKTMIFSQFIIKLAYSILGVGPIYATRALFRAYINKENSVS